MPIKIIRLDAVHSPSPTFDLPNLDFVEYNTTAPAQVVERAKEADILITTRARVTAETIASCPKLKLIAVSAAGTEIIDLSACKKAGIIVCNVPGASTEAVADHAFALYFAARRKIVELHALTLQSVEWPQKGTAVHKYEGLPLTCRKETMGIIGYGALGKHIADMAKALGMSVLVAERKGLPEVSTRPSRLSFLETIRQSTIIVLCCPLSDSTKAMIGEEEFKLMRRDCILVNVARGGIVVEQDLVKALQEGWIKGAGVDVFAVEPGSSKTSPLITEDGIIPNLTVSPHVAWYAKSSIEILQIVVKGIIENFVSDMPLPAENVVQK